jgi:glycosyltransferase involved in cell wall biosynthesis
MKTRLSLYSQADLRENIHYGYGHSFAKIAESIRQIKINGEPLIVDWNSPRSTAQIYYGPHPVQNSHYNHQYKIHMSQSESTEFEAHKQDAYRSADEFWTSGPMGVTAALNAGVPSQKIVLYEHGVDSSLYVPFLRGRRTKVRFLHIDSASGRKRADLAKRAFTSAFGANKNFELALKYSHFPHQGRSWHDGQTLEMGGTWVGPNVREIRETLSVEEMVSLLHFHDVLIYPSEGEGFGLIPLEALATGMPVISTAKWCSYEKYLLGNIIESSMGQTDTNWGYPHVGEWEVMNFDSIVWLMKLVSENISEQSLDFFKQTQEISDRYNWQNLTDKVIIDLFNRLN